MIVTYFLNALEFCYRTYEFSQHDEEFVNTNILFKIYDGTLKCYTQ